MMSVLICIYSIDAFYIPKSQYEKLSPEELDKMKQERFDSWRSKVNGN